MAILETATILDTAGTLIVVFDRQGKIQRFNRACETLTGYDEAEVKGQCAWDFLLAPAESSAMQVVFDRLVNGQANAYSQNTWLGKDGEKHTIAWSSTVLTNSQGTVDFVIASGLDFTEQRKNQRQLEKQYRQSHLLSEITREVNRSLALEAVLHTTVSEVQALLGCDRVFIIQAPANGAITLAAEATTYLEPPAELSPSSDRANRSNFHLFLQAAYVDHYRPQSISVIDMVAGPGAAPVIADILTSSAVKLELVVPILTQNQFWGLLVAHQCTQYRQWSPLEIDLMQQLAGQIGVAIHHAELLEHLEELVNERTAELTAANQQLRQEMSERWQTESALRRSEKQLRLVTNALPALVAYIDTYHRYRFNNYAYESWYGIPYQQITGRQVSDIVEPKVYQKMVPYLEQALNGQKVTYETEMVQNGDRRVWVSVSYMPDIQDDRVQGIFSMISDISDRKAIERLKDEFVSIVSHELRTPLTSVHGSLKLLATGQIGELGSQGKELVDIALDNTERLTRLINDVLDLERMTSDQVSIDPAPCLASDLINQAIKAMQSMAHDHSITLAAEAAPVMVWADSDYIMQALINLLSNAIKFSPKGATVLVKARSAINKVEFSVKDGGRGIPSDKLETIFERFQQVDTSDARERGGTGLGLAICREIIQQHQGRIWAKSLHGHGSTFYFTLPKPDVDKTMPASDAPTA
jgi:two-component system, OmpR family, sensor histidine kinase VicK